MLGAIAAACALTFAAAAPFDEAPALDGDLAVAFGCEVDRRLDVPASVQREYARRLAEALAGEGLLEGLEPQHVLLVDRSPNVQATFLYRLAPGGGWAFTGASPVATGQPGTFEHFATPLGVYAHSLDNPDFRAEGTLNENGIRGYGRAGMRVFDFGWVSAPRGWGDQRLGEMRLQVHATDPDMLEPDLGRARSKGCIRIPATLDDFLDRRGVLDADYERASGEGHGHWVLREERQPTRWPGRYLVVIDSGRAVRPDWSPMPGARATARRSVDCAPATR